MSAAEVFYLGPEGTFSHILARKRFGRGVRLTGCPTIEAVVDGAARPNAVALVPVENSSGGTVMDTIDILIARAGSVSVVEELALDVRIALLRRDHGPVRVVYSHFTQIKHHAAWLARHFPKARLAAVESTAVAARRAASAKGAAALAAPGAGAIYGLDVIEHPPASRTANVTHFFVVRAGAPADEASEGARKTALAATLPNVCGSLHAFLGPFARQRVSLSRIVSRPAPGQPQTYVFFLEIEGGPLDAAAVRAIKGAAGRARSLVSLGSFPFGRRFKS